MNYRVFNESALKNPEVIVDEVIDDRVFPDFILAIVPYDVDGCCVPWFDKPLIFIRCKNRLQFAKVFAHEFQHLLDYTKDGASGEEAPKKAEKPFAVREDSTKTLIVKV